MSKSTRFAHKLVRQAASPVVELPVFLCPGLVRALHVNLARHSQTPRYGPASCRRHFTSVAPITIENTGQAAPDTEVRLRSLPQQCVGCGALSQSVAKANAGFFSLGRASVRNYLTAGQEPKVSSEDLIVKKALEQADLQLEGFDIQNAPKSVDAVEPPVCDRCHNIRHQNTGVSIYHPSIESLQDTIFESPYKYNHVYHVLDAADFPMSLVPGLYKLFDLTPLRSRNRRAKKTRFYHGRNTTISFIITRSDLLAPQKEQVDHMMPYLRDVLRDALGRAAKDARLGNITCVSAKSAWWTKELKEEVWRRGAAGWMVGKVNVGKSQLFHEMFPKGRKTTLLRNLGTENKVLNLPHEGQTLYTLLLPGDESKTTESPYEKEDYVSTSADTLDTSSLLPPVPAEVDYPTMPLISSLPGTTASPIRLAYGNGKGELIDLPGLSRGDLELHVKPEHRAELVMRKRIKPEQQVLIPGKALLLGGFIRIQPTTPDVTILAYAFTPIHPHCTSTTKAINIQMHTGSPNVSNISLPETAAKIKSAGTFYLKWDVTRQRTGPITRPEAAGISPDRLPYNVLSTDILIEGCGWVELVAQVRKRPNEPLYRENGDYPAASQEQMVDPSWPAVEVFSPDGKFIGSRKPMGAWIISQKKQAYNAKGRPRKSMKGVKKLEKQRRNVASF